MAILLLTAVIIALSPEAKSILAAAVADDEKAKFLEVVQNLIDTRNNAILDRDEEELNSLYNTSTRYGTWAYEQQTKKMKYLHMWAQKQGILFGEITSRVVVKSLKNLGDGYRSYFVTTTTYTYIYENDPLSVNLFRIGSHHSLDIKPSGDEWLITKEWYTDPFADSLQLDDLKEDQFRELILSGNPRDFSDLNPRRIKAIDYADKYVGTAGNTQTGFSYNKKYRDYNPLGGDCANYASQVLYEGGGFRKTSSWNYGKDGSKAWLNAQGLKSFLLNSGRASTIAYGSYDKVFPSSFKMLPGDIVAYEKKGKVTHVSVVSGADSKGYPLVNCHNTDRYKVPWDLGWNDKGIKFYLLRVHY
ncbi:MAG: amidase domain-containing protein [Eubacteriales bacterium]|nr:amidase domain-containing protein [Eubacteriales bacterium]